MFARNHRRGLEQGREFLEAANFKRPLCVFAHHDDEVTPSGLLQRIGGDLSLVWMTNSDGRYFDSDLLPPAYGELRKAEGMEAAGLLGVPTRRIRNLDFSEVAIYRAMSRLHSGQGTWESEGALFEDMRRAVSKAVRNLKPDFVLTLAWQGGQPEHDLCHFFTYLALRDLEKESGKPIPFFHVPAYEYTYALAMRFHPMYRGQRMRIQLISQELKRKWDLIRAYPSQASLFKYFDWAFRFGFMPLGLLTGGPKSLDAFLGIEEFGPVPSGLDYSAKPHFFEKLNYMFDDFEGTPVSFSGSILPVVRNLL